MAEVAMGVPNKRYYIEKLQRFCKKRSLYTSVIDSQLNSQSQFVLFWTCESITLVGYINSVFTLIIVCDKTVANRIMHFHCQTTKGLNC